MDMTQFIQSAALLAGEEAQLSPEDQAMLDSLREDGMDLSLRGDMGLGTLYMNMGGDILAAAGMNGTDWYKMDMAALLAQSGVDWSELLSVSKNLDYTTLVKQALSSLELTDSTAAYDTVKTAVERVVAALSDEGFVKEGDRYTAVIDFEQGNTVVTLVFVMEMQKDVVTGYVMSMAMTAEEEGMTVSMDMTVGVDDKDQMTAEMHMDAAGLMIVEMTMEGGYTQGKTAPATEPPAGATIIDLMDPEGMNKALGIMPLE